MQGFVDNFESNNISGWAHDPEEPAAQVTVGLMVDGVMVATQVATIFRDDLFQAGFGDGHRAFFIDPSRHLLSEARAVRVIFLRTGETIPNGRGSMSRSVAGAGIEWERRQLAHPSRVQAMDRIGKIEREKWPLISIAMPTYSAEPEFLRRAVESVVFQTYPNWELIIVDDGSPDVVAKEFALGLSKLDSRIKTVALPANRGISGATNEAFGLCTGEFVALLDHDDELDPSALAEIAAVMLEKPDTDVVYTDQDKCDESNRCYEPFHKPEWSPILFLGVMYVGHLLVVRLSLVRAVGGCDSRFDRVQDYELMLRLSERTQRIYHLPKILYHWRALPGSIASSSDAKKKIEGIQAAAVQAHLDRMGVSLRAEPHARLPHRLQFWPRGLRFEVKISILIPTKNAPEHIARCLKSIFEKTSYPLFEVIAVDNGTTDRDALKTMASYPIQRIEYGDTFNFSKVNNLAANRATGDILVLLNNDTEVLSDDWLEVMLAQLMLPNVAAVGPMLIYPDGSVQHAGVVLGFRGTVDHVMRGFDPAWDGYGGSLACSREVSAVTAACLMVRQSDYLELGGLHEGYARIYQDADFCLQLREKGRSVLYVANALLRHHESASRGSTYDLVDRELFIDRWLPDLRRGDPYYNPNFTLDKFDYTLR